MKTTNDRLREALTKRAMAADNVGRVLDRYFPVGTQIEWMDRGHKQRGVVTMMGRQDRIQVRNEGTGRTLWIYAYRIVEEA